MVLRMLLVSLAIALAFGGAATAQSNSAGRGLVARVAQAMGGADRIQALRTLKYYGYSRYPLHEGGGNIDGSLNAPMVQTNFRDVERSFDLQNERMQVRQRRMQDFTFQITPGYLGYTREHQMLDGDIAFDIAVAPTPSAVMPTPRPTANAGQPRRLEAAAGVARRIERLNHPVTLVKTALDPRARIAAPRRNGAFTEVDVTTARGDAVRLGVDPETGLPAYISWVAPHENLGDVRFTTWFSGYEPEGGVMMPYGLNTKIDWRDVSAHEFFVTRYVVDGPIDDMSAPAAVRAMPVPVYQPPEIRATQIGKGIWYLTLTQGANTIVFEFADHMAIFELNMREEAAQAMIRRARALAPNKPLTQYIVSHHHFDHSAGFRTGVAEGLTVIADKRNAQILREMAARPGRDALGRSGRKLNLIAVDDHLKLKDSAMEIDLYRAIANSHMAATIFAYVPAEKLIVQADMFDPGWDINWWGDHYMQNVRFRNLQVERDAPVHGGQVRTLAELQSLVARANENTKQLCARATASGFYPPGCPYQW